MTRAIQTKHSKAHTRVLNEKGFVKGSSRAKPHEGKEKEKGARAAEKCRDALVVVDKLKSELLFNCDSVLWIGHTAFSLS